MKVFHSGLEYFLGSWMFFVALGVTWVAASLHLAKESGWKNLAGSYAGSSLAPTRKYSTVSGYVGSIHLSNSLKISFHSNGLALRMLFIFRLGCSDLDVPWSAIESIVISNKRSPKNVESIFDKLIEKLFNDRYAHINFSEHPNQAFVIPWNDELGDAIPSSVKLIFEDQ